MRSTASITALGLVLVALVIGSLLRSQQLDLRPMHTDEAIQADRLGDLIEGDGFTYNPKDGHGPGLLYLAAPVAALSGAKDYQGLDERSLRLTPALCGIALIGAALLFWKLLGPVGVAVAAILTALSPMHVYYSRYFIMELPMVLMLALFLFCAWRYMEKPGYGWMIGAGICCAWMHATKETFAISIAAFALAYGLIFALNRWRKDASTDLPLKPLLAHLAVGIGGCLVVSAALYSKLFTDLNAVVQSYATYGHYLERSEGSGHEKPFGYYLRLLTWQKMEKWTWTELLVLGLAVVGAVAAFADRSPPAKTRAFLRILALYALATLLIYSKIAYKTPWSILAFLHAAVILAGLGFSTLFKITPWLAGRAVLVIALGLGCWNLYHQDRVANFDWPAEPDRNPYVYGHTSTQLVNKLVAQIEELRGIKPDLSVQVFHPETGWPLPYYFRGMKKVGFWPTVTPPVLADVVIIDEAYQLELTELIENRYIGPDLRNLRENVMLNIYIERDLFFEMVERRSNES